MYEYRELSKEKSKSLNARRYTNMYRTEIRFDGGARCVTTETEDVVFKQIGFSHEDYIAQEYFLDYKGWYFYIYMFEKHAGSTKNDIGKDYHHINIISRIINVTSGQKENAPTEEEVIEILKDILPIWNQHNGGRLKPGDRILTEIQYKENSGT